MIFKQENYSKTKLNPLHTDFLIYNKFNQKKLSMKIVILILLNPNVELMISIHEF